MAHVVYAPDRKAPPIDLKLQEIALQAAAAGRPIRIRIQPDFYNFDATGYESWRGLIWTIDVEDIEEGRRLREGLAGFFAAFENPATQGELLKLVQGLAGGGA